MGRVLVLVGGSGVLEENTIGVDDVLFHQIIEELLVSSIFGTKIPRRVQSTLHHPRLILLELKLSLQVIKFLLQFARFGLAHSHYVSGRLGYIKVRVYLQVRNA